MKPRSLVALMLLALTSMAAAADAPRYSRDPNQAIDEQYTRKIKEYTTEPFFMSPLVDYLPSSKTVPNPGAVLGDIAGAPGKLPYTADVNRYMRMLEQASPRVRVFSIGRSEEGREMIAVAISSEANIAKLEENRSRLAKLADPRAIGMKEAEADRLVDVSVPVYYITGTIHSPETGAVTALMELAYRLAVDESPYIKAIRGGLITLITPVVETDGRDRQVDVYNWHLAHPGQNWPPLVYWGKYVAHDNNRDAMGLSLALTRNVLRTFIDWKAQVLHDLHESVPYLYDNTVGDGPYNAWIDPILADEWQMIGYSNMAELTKFGMPGVFAHGTFDTWSPGYLMFIAASHNGISRLYETFGNGGADTVERTLSPREYARTWYRQNPPLPKARWSQRNNNNYQISGLLVSLSQFTANNRLFLKNFYLKSRNSIEKPRVAGPAAYVFPADDPRPAAQAELLRVLQLQGCEISRATAPFKANVEAKKRPAGGKPDEKPAEPGSAQGARKPQVEVREFPAQSYLVRMDQPYSRIADMLLDHQYWSPGDPQRTPFDDTGWTFGEAHNVRVVRVTDVSVLDAPMERVQGEVRAPGGVRGQGGTYVLNHNTDVSIATFRFRMKDIAMDAAEEPFEADGTKFNRGSLIFKTPDRAAADKAASELGLVIHAVDSVPAVKTHPSRAARIALLHTWLSTQDEGWWRLAFDSAAIPYTYISTQAVAREDNLRSKYDVILFPPVGRSGVQGIVSGMPMFGNPLPWTTTPATPNLGKVDSTDDMRPGLGWKGLQNLQEFVQEGGLLVGSMDTADFAVQLGFTRGVSINPAQRMRIVGSFLRSRFVDSASPIAYGYGDELPVYCNNGPVFGVSNTVGGRGGRFGGPVGERERATGRGLPDEVDQPQNRPAAEIPEEPRAEPWQATPLTDEQLRNGIYVIPPELRPRVVLRYADAKDLQLSGLVEGGNEIAQRPAVIDVPSGKGHVVLFSINPVWRGQTRGTYFLVLNAALNFDSLGAGRKLDAR
jgi:hypothetical protein